MKRSLSGRELIEEIMSAEVEQANNKNGSIAVEEEDDVIVRRQQSSSDDDDSSEAAVEAAADKTSSESEIIVVKNGSDDIKAPNAFRKDGEPDYKPKKVKIKKRVKEHPHYWCWIDL